MIVSVAPGGGSRGSDMIVSVAAAGMLMATAAEAPLGREKKRKKRAPARGVRTRDLRSPPRYWCDALTRRLLSRGKSRPPNERGYLTFRL